jgi:hypothetical protein
MLTEVWGGEGGWREGRGGRGEAMIGGRVRRALIGGRGRGEWSGKEAGGRLCGTIDKALITRRDRRPREGAAFLFILLCVLYFVVQNQLLPSLIDNCCPVYLPERIPCPLSHAAHLDELEEALCRLLVN